MTTITRTADLRILKVWLIGGTVDRSGDYAEGFHSLTHPDEALTLDDIKETVTYLIDCEGEDPMMDGVGWPYFDKIYRFKMPKPKNFEILCKRIQKQLKEWEKENEDH